MSASDDGCCDGCCGVVAVGGDAVGDVGDAVVVAAADDCRCDGCLDLWSPLLSLVYCVASAVGDADVVGIVVVVDELFAAAVVG